MNRNRTTLLGAALAVVGALLLAVFVVGGRPDATAREPEETVTVIRAVDGLQPGTPGDALGGRTVATAVPVSIAPERHITDLADVAGREVLRTVGPGEILVHDQFAQAGPLAGGLVVPAGYEALAVEAEPAPGVEGYVTPGARVNVYATVTVPGQDPQTGQAVEQQYTQLVVAHVDVLAVTRGDLTGAARPPENEAFDNRVVLLLQVRPADAPVVVDAVRRGQLWFTIVNPDDPPPAAQRVDVEQLDPGLRTQAISDARHQQDETGVQGASRQ